MRSIKILLLVFFILACRCYKHSSDVTRSIVEIIEHNDYPVQTLNIKTSDDYELKVFRISGPKGSKPSTDRSKKQPVLLMHGLVVSHYLSLL